MTNIAIPQDLTSDAMRCANAFANAIALDSDHPVVASIRKWVEQCLDASSYAGMSAFGIFCRILEGMLGHPTGAQDNKDLVNPSIAFHCWEILSALKAFKKERGENVASPESWRNFFACVMRVAAEEAHRGTTIDEACLDELRAIFEGGFDDDAADEASELRRIMPHIILAFIGIRDRYKALGECSKDDPDFGEWFRGCCGAQIKWSRAISEAIDGKGGYGDPVVWTGNCLMPSLAPGRSRSKAKTPTAPVPNLRGAIGDLEPVEAPGEIGGIIQSVTSTGMFKTAVIDRLAATLSEANLLGGSTSVTPDGIRRQLAKHDPLMTCRALVMLRVLLNATGTWKKLADAINDANVEANIHKQLEETWPSSPFGVNEGSSYDAEGVDETTGDISKCLFELLRARHAFETMFGVSLPEISLGSFAVDAADESDGDDL